MASSSGEGWTAATLDDLGEGPGFRKVRDPLGVTAFGVNAIVIPPGHESREHYHDEQEELYFAYSGTFEMTFGDGSSTQLEPGTFVRVAPKTVRRLKNVGETDAIYVCVGGKDGYVGRDGHVPES
ncbi:MAG TPA: cupin domain-containing protein [Solirubrobacteraceae bacterium]|jgi:mannose-6-phosphate isomerase-like protein (cupin superfamily)